MFKGFERFKRPLLILSLPYLLIILAFSMRIDYRIYAPGGLNPVGNFIEFEDAYESQNPLSTTYIMNVEEPTPFQTLMGKLSPTLTLSELPEYREGISDSVNYESAQVSKNTSVDLALINAYEALGLSITYETEHIISLYYDYIEASNLDIGDIVLSVNGDEDIKDAFDRVACEEDAHLEVRKEDGDVETASITKQERDGDCLFGIRISTYYRITDSEVPYTIKDSPIGGPSGGLMQTLYIYNALSEADLTKDRVIAGTGTIRIDGSVGAIGGVREKVFTAHKAGVDIFFVPTGSNHEDALKAMRSLNNPSMELVAVDSFEEALTYLEGMRT